MARDMLGFDCGILGFVVLFFFKATSKLNKLITVLNSGAR